MPPSGYHALALGDVFGGPAFQVCYLLADLIAGAPVLPSSGRLNSWLAALAIGVVARPERCRACLGPDSILALIGLGIAGLFVLPR